eukprot:501437-Prorocentrum_minimum.AAC.1
MFVRAAPPEPPISPAGSKPKPAKCITEFKAKFNAYGTAVRCFVRKRKEQMRSWGGEEEEEEEEEEEGHSVMLARDRALMQPVAKEAVYRCDTNQH